MSLYSPSHPFFLDKIKEIYNIDVSLFFYLSKKKYSFALVETWGPHEFQDDYLEVLYIDSARAKT